MERFRIKLNIFFCAYKKIGKNVIKYAINNYDINNIAVFTSKQHREVIDFCEKENIWYTDKNINNLDTPPFVPDVISSIYYPYIIDERWIDLVKGKIFNIHPSLLPNHRGCSSIPWAIIDGDKVTGITYHYIDNKIDTGKIILQTALQISPTDTQLSLQNKMMKIGASMWPAAFELVLSNFKGIEQSGEVIQYHKRECPYNGNIDDQWDDAKVERFIRAMYYPPLPGAFYKDKEIKSMKEYLIIKEGSIG